MAARQIKIQALYSVHYSSSVFGKRMTAMHNDYLNVFVVRFSPGNSNLNILRCRQRLACIIHNLNCKSKEANSFQTILSSMLNISQRLACHKFLHIFSCRLHTRAQFLAFYWHLPTSPRHFTFWTVPYNATSF